MTVIALVPARGGSKGIPRKNLVEVAGRPLLSWTIAAAQQSGVVDRIVVSTDDDEIARAAQDLGAEVPFRRSPELSDDHATAVDVAIDALDRLGDPDWLLLLQPTSPLRSAEDVRSAVRLASDDVERVVSVRPVRDHPAWLLRVAGDGMLEPWSGSAATRRQDEPALVVPNGAIYLIRPAALRRDRSWVGSRTRAYNMPEERSIDVDTSWDLRVASLVLASAATARSRT